MSTTMSGRVAFRTSVCVVLWLLSIGFASGQINLISNGTFEGGFLPDGNCDLQEPDNDRLPVGWTCLETFNAGFQEPSLISQFPNNGPSLPGSISVKVFRADQCSLSGDWTTIEQGIGADVSGCLSLILRMDVMLVPMVPPHSHNVGGSGHVAGPCDPRGFEYPVTVKVDYTDTGGAAQCWQYGWYQYATTQANRTDPGCVSGFDGQNANPNPALSRMIGVNVWVASAFDLLAQLPNVRRIDKIRVGGSGWSFDGAVDNVQLICENLCAQGPYPQCGGPCPSGRICMPNLTTDACQCVVPCEQGPYPQCSDWCLPGLGCVAGPGACMCEPLPCEQWPYPQCGGPCPAGETCVTNTTIGACLCEPLPCEQWPYPQCGGPCPAGQTCVTNTTIGACVCEPLPCEQWPYPQCGGPCPAGQTCVVGAGSCVCEAPDSTVYKADWPDYAPSGMPDFEQLHAFVDPLPPINPRTACGPTAMLDSFWWFDSEVECDTHHTAGDQAETEPNGLCTMADTLGETPPIPGVLMNPGDRDWYAFEVPKGGLVDCSIILSTFARARPGDADTRLSLYASCDPSGVPGPLIASNDDSPWGGLQSEVSGWPTPGLLLPSGKYVVLVEVGHTGMPGPYTLSLGLDCHPLIQRWTQTAPDDHSEHNTEQLIASLWLCANTDDQMGGGRWKGTLLQDMQGCVDLWLTAMGLTSSYTRRLVLAPSFEEVEQEVERSEDVMLLLGFYWRLGPQWIRCGGHYVTAAGVDSANRTITVSDPLLNNAEPPPAGNAAPGRVRGPDHADHAPGAAPPPDHDDARNVSHDRYAVGPPMVVPPVSLWSLPSYATAGTPTTCENVITWCGGSDHGQNPLQYPQTQEPCADLAMPVAVEVEAMLDVSPIQTLVCIELDPVVPWPDNLRVRKGACQPGQPQLFAYDLIRGKSCGLRLAPAIAQVDLGYVQCLYDNVMSNRFEERSPDDDRCFGAWFYLLRRSGDASYGAAHPGGEAELPSSGGCP